MDKKLYQLVAEYMNDQKLMQLATIGSDGLWACSVWYSFDDDLNIYYFSSTKQEHSKQIEKDNRVAGAMALPMTPQDEPRGLQFRGTASRLIADGDVAMARSTYEGRIFESDMIDALTQDNDRPHAFYRITPTIFVLFDAVNYPDSPRQELVINVIRGD